MKSSLSRGISLRNSKRRRRSLGKRRYNDTDDTVDYLTKYGLKYEKKEVKKKEKHKSKIRSIKITSEKSQKEKSPKEQSPKEKSPKEKSHKEKSSKEKLDLLALLDDNQVFKKSPKEEKMKEEESPKKSQEGGLNPDVKSIFITNFEAEDDRNPLKL